MKIKTAILTSSDQGYAGLREDLSGSTIRECLKGIDHEVIWHGILPDDREMIREKLIELVDKMGAELILTTGGTGLSPRDVTPDATMDVAHRTIPGIAEALHLANVQKAPRSILSRSVCVTRNQAMIVNFPGSPKACRECMEIILPIAEHAVSVLKGQVQNCAVSE